MYLSRRAFTGGALGLAIGSQLALPAIAQASPSLATTLAAIRAYGESHLSYWRLPGMTLGVTLPDGFSTVMNFGFANTDARTPITDDTLFQIGSISKVMVATVLHQLAAEGRFKLTQRLSDLLPAIPFPAGNTITVQHLLDHVAGLPGDAPTFAEGGLWTAYAPGAHWHYSNTGYEILGKLAEHIAAMPLDRLLEQRIFRSLGMSRSRGAIVADDRVRYAQGYEAADQIIPFVRGVPLAPAAWVDVTFGAGCVASTAADMIRYLRTLANATQGRGGLGLPPELARIFTTHAVASDTPGMSYGNGLMHVSNGARSYLHHTGGMVSFSSSFHVDTVSGVGAFASSTISAFAEYRPRLLTRFAVDALTNAIAGKPLPPIPPLDLPLANPSLFVGRYSGPAGAFEVRSGSPLSIVADGRSAELQYTGGSLFRTLHPAFRRFSLLFDRHGPGVALASWGPNSYLREGAAASLPASDPQLARLAGRYVNDSPWLGTAYVVERGGKLWIGTETPMAKLAENLWRVGEDSWSPERASFANFIDGRPRTFVFSGEKFLRHDV
jgi:CubicO group peptidase (beta-lactamase class C family)